MRTENAIVIVGIEVVTEGWLAFEIRRGQDDASGRYTRTAAVDEVPSYHHTREYTRTSSVRVPSLEMAVHLQHA